MTGLAAALDGAPSAILWVGAGGASHGAPARYQEPISTREGIRGVANHLRTSFGATLQYLTNLGFIDEHEQQRIAASA